MGMVGLTGVSWGLTLWAPFALIAECVSHINDVSRRDSLASSVKSSRSRTPDIRPADSPSTPSALPTSGISISNPDERRPSPSLLPPVVIPRPILQPRENSPLLPPPPEKRDEITSAGAIMGLHNVFISSPQFISTLLAGIIFHFLGAGGRGDDIPALSMGTGPGIEGRAGGSIPWVLRIGGLGGVYAAYLTWKLSEEIE